MSKLLLPLDIFKGLFNKKYIYIYILKKEQYEVHKNEPSFRMAMISTINGGKSNFHMSASSMKPSCNKT